MSAVSFGGQKRPVQEQFVYDEEDSCIKYGCNERLADEFRPIQRTERRQQKNRESPKGMNPQSFYVYRRDSSSNNGLDRISDISYRSSDSQVSGTSAEIAKISTRQIVHELRRRQQERHERKSLKKYRGSRGKSSSGGYSDARQNDSGNSFSDLVQSQYSPKQKQEQKELYLIQKNWEVTSNNNQPQNYNQQYYLQQSNELNYNQNMKSNYYRKEQQYQPVQQELWGKNKQSPQKIGYKEDEYINELGKKEKIEFYYKAPSPVKYEGFRPPYADSNIRTGFSGIVEGPPIKQRSQVSDHINFANRKSGVRLKRGELAGDSSMSSDIEEANKKSKTPVIQRKSLIHENQTKLHQKMVQRREMSPNRSKIKQYAKGTSPQRRQKSQEIIQPKKQSRVQQNEEQLALDAEWLKIREKIDREYEQKLKDAMHNSYVCSVCSKSKEEKQYVYDERKSPEQKSPRKANKSFNEQPPAQDIVVSSGKEEAKFLKRLHEEYMAIIHSRKQKYGYVYLVDILIDLYFIRYDNSQKSIAFIKFLRESESNLLVESIDTSEDIAKNLFKILCAIMGFRFHQRSHNIIDDKTFSTHIYEIRSHNNEEAQVIDQLLAIRQIIDRPSFSLNERQQNEIYQRYTNMSEYRVYILRKVQTPQIIVKMETPAQHYKYYEIEKSYDQQRQIPPPKEFQSPVSPQTLVPNYRPPVQYESKEPTIKYRQQMDEYVYNAPKEIDLYENQLELQNRVSYHVRMQKQIKEQELRKLEYQMPEQKAHTPQVVAKPLQPPVNEKKWEAELPKYQYMPPIEETSESENQLRQAELNKGRHARSPIKSAVISPRQDNSQPKKRDPKLTVTGPQRQHPTANTEVVQVLDYSPSARSRQRAHTNKYGFDPDEELLNESYSKTEIQKPQVRQLQPQRPQQQKPQQQKYQSPQSQQPQHQPQPQPRLQHQQPQPQPQKQIWPKQKLPSEEPELWSRKPVESEPYVKPPMRQNPKPVVLNSSYQKPQTPREQPMQSPYQPRIQQKVYQPVVAQQPQPRVQQRPPPNQQEDRFWPNSVPAQEKRRDSPEWPADQKREWPEERPMSIPVKEVRRSPPRQKSPPGRRSGVVQEQQPRRSPPKQLPEQQNQPKQWPPQQEVQPKQVWPKQPEEPSRRSPEQQQPQRRVSPDRQQWPQQEQPQRRISPDRQQWPRQEEPQRRVSPERQQWPQQIEQPNRRSPQQQWPQQQQQPQPEQQWPRQEQPQRRSPQQQWPQQEQPQRRTSPERQIQPQRRSPEQTWPQQQEQPIRRISPPKLDEQNPIQRRTPPKQWPPQQQQQPEERQRSPPKQWPQRQSPLENIPERNSPSEQKSPPENWPPRDQPIKRNSPVQKWPPRDQVDPIRPPNKPWAPYEQQQPAPSQTDVRTPTNDWPSSKRNSPVQQEPSWADKPVQRQSPQQQRKQPSPPVRQPPIQHSGCERGICPVPGCRPPPKQKLPSPRRVKPYQEPDLDKPQYLLPVQQPRQSVPQLPLNQLPEPMEVYPSSDNMVEPMKQETPSDQQQLRYDRPVQDTFGKPKDFGSKKPSMQQKVPQTARTNPQNRRQSEEDKRPKTDRQKSKGRKPKPLGSFRPTPLSGPQKFRLDKAAEKPICVLKIELDGGNNTEVIEVFNGQNPEDIVQEFAERFNLSDNAKARLLVQVNRQIEEGTQF